MLHACTHIGFLAAIALSCFASVTFAGEKAERPGPWHLGAGGIVLDKPYAAGETEFKAFPVVGYLGERLQVFGPRASYMLATNGTFSLKADASIRFSGYDPEDSTALQGMEEREMTLEAGFTVSAGGEWGELGLSLLTDVLGRHSGEEAVFRYGYEISRERFAITPFAGLRWISSDLGDYYYGVRPVEATSSRSTYLATSSTSPFVGVSTRYRLSSRWSLFALLASERLGGELRDSPIVEDDSSSMLLLTLTRSL